MANKGGEIYAYLIYGFYILVGIISVIIAWYLVQPNNWKTILLFLLVSWVLVVLIALLVVGIGAWLFDDI